MEGGKSLHKKLKITFNAPVTLGFVIMCFIATLLGVISQERITQSVFMTYHSSLTNPMTYVRFITHIFGHSGWSHFIGNASYLLLLGLLPVLIVVLLLILRNFYCLVHFEMSAFLVRLQLLPQILHLYQCMQL